MMTCTPLPALTTNGDQAAQLLAGQGDGLVLGQYRVLDQLGAGGTGRVYKAEHRLMRRLVAIKVIEPHVISDPAAVARFHAEVQVAAQLAHPNIVTAFDADEANGLHFLVMEYVDGIDLGRLVEENGPLSCALACEYVRQAALGLQHACEHGLVHCDIKPANLLLRQGVTLSGGALPALIKILDFGVARLIGATTESTTVLSLSEQGNTCAGTPDYMAPEQAYDYQATDIRSDLYSLGCTFFYLLTGQVPYLGGTWSEKLLRHQFDPTPSPRQLRPEVPAGVAAVAQRLMAKEPGERFQTPVELAAALYDHLSRSSPSGGFSLTAVGEEAKSQASTRLEVTPGRETRATGSCSLVRTHKPETQATDLQACVPMRSEPTAKKFSARRVFWPAAICGAVAAGLVIAGIARWISLESRAAASRPGTPIAATLSNAILLNSIPRTPFVRLDAAIAAACDGDTLILHGSGPFPTRPLSLLNKSLTLKAGPGCRPRIELAPTAADAGWQALITCNRPLALEGLELGLKQKTDLTGRPETTHLLYAERTSVRLENCHLVAPNGCALVVCRNTKDLQLHNCLVMAHASAVCVDVGDESNPTIELSQCKFALHDPCGAALCIWTTSLSRPAAVRLSLQQSVFDSGRVLSLNGLSRGMAVSAAGNTFCFHEALLSCTGSADCCRRQIASWQGQNNLYKSPADWLSINGVPAGIHGLRGWLEYWQATEAGSLEETSSYPLETAHHGPAN